METAKRIGLLIGMLFLHLLGTAASEDVVVKTRDELIRAVNDARPGVHILIAPGEYRGRLLFSDVKGAEKQPIVIAAQDLKRPPIFSDGIQFSDPQYLEIRNIEIRNAPGNGLNIDDGGSYDTPARRLLLQGIKVLGASPKGNRDGIKLSGVDDFVVTSCTVVRWGDGGSGIDMVGCHRGRIEHSRFEHGDATGGNAVQTKGGSTDILIRGCEFIHAGQRAINIGGSTGMAYFRPKPQGYEAKGVTVERCVFHGSMAPIAFVGVDGATVRCNTIYRPARWVVRVLQETRSPEFVPSRRGVFERNIVVFRSDEVADFVNIGPGTSPETFSFRRNLWYCLDRPERSSPRLPVKEQDGIVGVDPQLADPENGEFRTKAASPAGKLDVGADTASIP